MYISIIKAHNLLCESEEDQMSLDLGDTKSEPKPKGDLFGESKNNITIHTKINFKKITDWINSIPSDSDELEEFIVDEENHITAVLGRAIGNPNNYRGSADWGGADVWSLSEAPESGDDGFVGEYIAVFDHDVVLGYRDEDEYSEDTIHTEMSLDDVFDKKALTRFFDEVKSHVDESVIEEGWG
jgi:hypothetical protein